MSKSDTHPFCQTALWRCLAGLAGTPVGRPVCRLLRAYFQIFPRLTERGRPWRLYVWHLLVAFGVPMAFCWVVLACLAALGIATVTVDGGKVGGAPAFWLAVQVAFVHVPLLCLFVGSIAYFVEEKLRN